MCNLWFCRHFAFELGMERYADRAKEHSVKPKIK
uniref:Uncharacterized protein n=1 Tax=Arundo donax TaxID=35708 RepID=A0A0A8ZQD9_ARUDO